MGRILADATNVRDAVLGAIGAASVLFVNDDGTRLDGVFDDARALAITDELMDDWVNKPRLGLASTMSLIDELQARARVASVVGETWPGYRTVGGE